MIEPMNSLANERILVGITGGIAAYKSAELVRLLIKHGADVQVVMTPAAEAFITPLTLQALSGKAVRTSLLDEQAELGMGHIELARWATCVIVAPASADFIARMATGMANDLLSTVMLAFKGPVFLAPAMNQAMYSNPMTQKNLQTLLDLRLEVTILGPASGEQACGDTGPGRMLEPAEIVSRINDSPPAMLAGKKVVITAGPTQEPVDPVRYISNHSSGKMGYAIAAAALSAGAEVTLISGPVALQPPAGARLVNVTTAIEMANAALEHCSHADIFIATAAVADFRPDTVHPHKLKKTSTSAALDLHLVQNPDIVAQVAALGNDRPAKVVGFAAESRDAEKYGAEKRTRKQLDMIVINDISVAGLGFGSNYNKVTILTGESRTEIGPSLKTDIARQLIAFMAEHWQLNSSDLKENNEVSTS